MEYGTLGSSGIRKSWLCVGCMSFGDPARDKVVLATKVYFNEGHLSKKAIAREVEGSLKRLGTDYVDLWSGRRIRCAARQM